MRNNAKIAGPDWHPISLQNAINFYSNAYHSHKFYENSCTNSEYSFLLIKRQTNKQRQIRNHNFAITDKTDSDCCQCHVEYFESSAVVGGQGCAVWCALLESRFVACVKSNRCVLSATNHLRLIIAFCSR